VNPIVKMNPITMIPIEDQLIVIELMTLLRKKRDKSIQASPARQDSDQRLQSQHEIPHYIESASLSQHRQHQPEHHFLQSILHHLQMLPIRPVVSY